MSTANSASKTPIRDAAHAAAIDEILRSARARVEADLDAAGVGVSVNTTKANWTFTAYVRRAWNGARAAGLRVSRPLGLFGSK